MGVKEEEELHNKAETKMREAFENAEEQEEDEEMEKFII